MFLNSLDRRDPHAPERAFHILLGSVVQKVDNSIHRINTSKSNRRLISADMAAILIFIVSNGYYGTPREKIRVNLPPEYPKYLSKP